MSYEHNTFTQGTVLSASSSTAMPTWHGGSALPTCRVPEKKLPDGSLLSFSLSSAVFSGFFFLERAWVPFDRSFRTRGCTFETLVARVDVAMDVDDGHAARHGETDVAWPSQAWTWLRGTAVKLRRRRRKTWKAAHAPAAWDARQMDAARVQELRLARTKRNACETMRDGSRREGESEHLQVHPKKTRTFLMSEIRPVHCVVVNAALFMLLLYVKP